MQRCGSRSQFSDPDKLTAKLSSQYDLGISVLMKGIRGNASFDITGGQV